MSLHVWADTEFVLVGGTPAPTPDPDPDPTPPPAVIILSAVSPSSTELTVSWLQPTWSGGTVAHYEVDLNGSDYDSSVEATSITIGGLEEDTDYTITVRAVSTDDLTGSSSSTIGRTQVAPPPTSNFPAVWDAMIATHDDQAIEDTFALYTGYRVPYAELTNVGGTINSTHDGQVIERVRGSALRITHNNVTVRDCLIGPGNTYGLYTNPTFGWDGTGLVVEHCTFDGTIGSGAPVDKAGAVFQNDNAGAALIRYCEWRGWSSGILANSGVTVEYSWFTNFFGSSTAGAHVSSLNARGSNVRFYRNLATEGGSPICSIYFDTRPVHNVQILENVLTASLSDSGNTPSYLLFFKSGSHDDTATNITLGGNILGSGYQYGITAQLNLVPWGTNGNVRTSDFDLFTGDPI